MKWFRNDTSLVDLTCFQRIWKSERGDPAIFLESMDPNGLLVTLHYSDVISRNEAFEQICTLLMLDQYFLEDYQKN